jgi:nitrite reductase/ring-hydroxylating ferredoxin subunit
MPWHTVAAVADVPPGRGVEAVAGDRIVALFNVDGEFFALDGVCPHQGGPLGKGDLQGCIVTCPWHGWQFDVTSGEFQLRKSLVQPKFNTRVVDGRVQVEIDD